VKSQVVSGRSIKDDESQAHPGY